jgi:hypothetical protein
MENILPGSITCNSGPALDLDRAVEHLSQAPMEPKAT